MSFGLNFALSAFAFTTPAQSGPMTIDEAVAIGERNAFGVLLQQVAVEKAANRASEATTALRPRANATLTYLRNEKAQTTSFGAGQTIVTQPLDTTTMNASLTFPIDWSGAVRKQIEAARKSKQAAEFTLASTINEVRLAVRNSYFNVLRSQDGVRVAEQNLAQAKAQRDQIAKRVEEQDAARVELVRFDAQVAAAESDVIAAKNGLEIAKQNLNQTLGRPVEQEFDAVPITAMPAVDGDFPKLVEAAHSTRPDVKAVETSIQALKAGKSATARSNWPTLSAALNHQRNLGDLGFAGQEQSTNGTIVLSVPLYDQGATGERVKQAQRDIETGEIQLKQLKLAVSAEVRSALTNLTNAQARLASAEAQVRFAEETYRISVIRRDAGEGTYVEVIDALAQSTLARNQVVSARYDYLTAYAALQKAVGKDQMNGGMN